MWPHFLTCQTYTNQRHAQKILSVLSSVFKDISCDEDWHWNGTHFDHNQEFDDEFMDEWDEILQDIELIVRYDCGKHIIIPV